MTEVQTAQTSDPQDVNMLSVGVKSPLAWLGIPDVDDV